MEDSGSKLLDPRPPRGSTARRTERRFAFKDTAHIRRRILSNKATVVVIGQGYVGLTLACAAAEAGFAVQGIDVDTARIADLSRAKLVVPGVSEGVFRAGVATGRISFTTDTAVIRNGDVILIPSRDVTARS